MKNIILALVVSCFGVAWVSAATENPITTPGGEFAGRVVLPTGAKNADIQAAVVEAAVGRGWTVTSKADDHVVLFLEDGRWVSNLTLRWSGQEISILSNSTRGGKQKIPESWVEYLQEDITKLINEKTLLK